MIGFDEPQANWISLDSWQRDADPIQPTPIAFRFDLFLTENQLTGWLEATASHSYVLWINGHPALRGPTRSFPGDRFVDTLSLDGWLKAGRNAISVILMPPTGVLGYSCPTRSGFYCRGRIEGPDTLSFGSNGDWRACEAIWITSHRLLLSLAAGAQEHWDLSLSPECWLTASAEHWNPVRVLGGAGTPPWIRFRPNPISRLQLEAFRPALVWQGADNRLAGNPLENLALAFSINPKSTGIHPYVTEDIFSSVKENIFVWDMGKTRLFQPGLEVLEAGPDTQIEWYYDIKLDDHPSVMRGFGTTREGFCDSVKVTVGSTKWQSLQPRGGRFATMRIAGSAPCRFRPNISLLEYPFPHQVEFKSDHHWLEDLWTVSMETLCSCCTDAIVDTCARENNLWTFDACVAGKAICYTLGDTTLWRHCLQLIGDGISPEGVPLAVVPAESSFMCLFDQTFQWLISVEEYFHLTGDLTLLEDISAPMQRFLSLCENLLTVEDLFVPPSYSWHWIDWAPLDRRAYSLPINAAFARASRVACALGNAAGQPELTKTALQITHRLEPALELFFDQDLGLYRDHIPPTISTEPNNSFLCTPPEKSLSFSLHGNLQMASLLPPESARSQCVLANVIPWLAEPHSSQTTFGPGWVQHLLKPLIEAGYVQESLDILKQKHGPQLATGSRTLAEGFAPQLHNSAHAWGASVNSLIVEDLIGVAPHGPKVFQINPRIEGDFAYERKSPQGSFGLKRARNQLSLKIPSGYSAKYKGQTFSGDQSWQTLKPYID